MKMCFTSTFIYSYMKNFGGLALKQRQKYLEMAYFKGYYKTRSKTTLEFTQYISIYPWYPGSLARFAENIKLDGTAYAL